MSPEEATKLGFIVPSDAKGALTITRSRVTDIALHVTDTAGGSAAAWHRGATEHAYRKYVVHTATGQYPGSVYGEGGAITTHRGIIRRLVELAHAKAGENTLTVINKGKSNEVPFDLIRAITFEDVTVWRQHSAALFTVQVTPDEEGAKPSPLMCFTALELVDLAKSDGDLRTVLPTLSRGDSYTARTEHAQLAITRI